MKLLDVVGVTVHRAAGYSLLPSSNQEVLHPPSNNFILNCRHGYFAGFLRPVPFHLNPPRLTGLGNFDVIFPNDLVRPAPAPAWVTFRALVFIDSLDPAPGCVPFRAAIVIPSE